MNGRARSNGEAWLKHGPDRLLGTALVLAAWDPVGLLPDQPLLLVPAAATLAAAWWAAAPVVRRPVRAPGRLAAQLRRHRNTVLAAGSVGLAALTRPGPWAAAAVTVLLLGYLLLVDAAAAGPSGRRQLRDRLALTAALGATGLVLLAAFAPVSATAAGPVFALVAVAVAAGAVWAALRPRPEG